MKVVKQSVLPKWLARALVFAFILSACSVSSFALLTAYAYLERPFNPLEGETQVVDSGGGLDIGGLLSTPEPEEEAVPPVIIDEAGTPLPDPTLDPTAVAIGQLAASKPDDRITVLLMGIDRRPGEAFISRTDSMMLLSLNPETNRAAILSVPRDLYVEIPGYGRDRINTAMVRGAVYGGPAGGAQLAIDTISYNLGVHVDHYMLVDFGAFVEAIDSIDGITVDVPFIINDPTYPSMNYGYDPLYISSGRQQFDGELALKYARTRHVDNDFGRAQRQQQVLLAARDKIISLGVKEMLLKFPILYAQLEEGIRTDLSPAQMITLASAAADVPPENIEREVIDYRYVVSYRTLEGADVLVLQNYLVSPVVQEMFFDD